MAKWSAATEFAPPTSGLTRLGLLGSDLRQTANDTVDAYEAKLANKRNAPARRRAREEDADYSESRGRKTKRPKKKRPLT